MRPPFWLPVALAQLCLAPVVAADLDLPWESVGLSEREAAAHLLNRFTFGPRPGDIDAVVAAGLEDWFESQLEAQAPEPALDARLVDIEALFLPIEEFAVRYPSRGLFMRQAMAAGVLPEDFDPQRRGDERFSEETRRKVLAFGREQGFRPQRELIGALLAQKVYRAVYAENQLQEVLTDFWFNHFNVSLTDRECSTYILSYERDAIRPFVLANFRDMLGATARHPAMLLYLDNAQSTAAAGDRTTLQERMGSRGGRASTWSRSRRQGEMVRLDRKRHDRPQGLNENYARELLELHTLGVDGGYTQKDVVEVARAFTGWSTLRPQMLMDVEVKRRVRHALSLGAGFVLEDGFVFRADAHDAGKKTVLGHTLRVGRGLEDGEDVLDLVAAHASTARHLARKLAVRFVSDAPPPALVDRLAQAFVAAHGEFAPVLRALVSAPEFWAAEARGEKVKAPFELAMSAVRAIDAEIDDPRGVVEWVERMGQPLYAYSAPTGYPDAAEFWVNAGALLNRMNFALSLAAGRVPGVSFDLGALLDGREPESRAEALGAYVELLLPERDAEVMVELLEPMAMAPDLAERIAAATPEAQPLAVIAETDFAGFGRSGREAPLPTSTRPPTAIEQVAGVILGSPEFQKR
ncbi:MAG: DUF1800 domain-containing protein [Acidobacteria bacterium]|nr:DUF1800 domain-containing protein [Acidobacteriota bacterium]